MVDLKNKCLDCCRCHIGGKTIDGDRCNVFSNMNTDAEIVVVGQNPGLQEIKQATPFIGPSGKFFDKILQEEGISRSCMYITNVIKCMTPENRKPSDEEMDNCQDFLDLEIKTIKPKAIVALGGFALQRITGLNGIMKHVGKVIVSPRYGVDVIVCLHPSPLNMKNKDRRELLVQAIRKLKDYI
tara:strand:+ start:7687 stop:8238 length:552 start_codon:yes stop_codon:yes gene_type:complete